MVLAYLLFWKMLTLKLSSLAAMCQLSQRPHATTRRGSQSLTHHSKGGCTIGVASRTWNGIMDAKPIIEAMFEQYVRCISYEDIGTFEQVMSFSSRREKSRGTFSTTFIRPKLLRFDLNHAKSDFSQQTTIQSDGESYRAMSIFTPDTNSQIALPLMTL